MRRPATSGRGCAVNRCAPTPYFTPGSDSQLSSKPSSLNQPQICGTRSGAARPRVHRVVPPVAHSWAQQATVRLMSDSVMLPNTPQARTRSAGTRPA